MLAPRQSLTLSVAIAAFLHALIVCSPPVAAQVLTVTPLVDCTADNGNGTFRAVFGYFNPHALAVPLTVGLLNSFNPPPQDRWQPTTFQPGRHRSAVVVSSASSSTSWAY